MRQTYTLSHADAMKIIEVIRTDLETDKKGAAIAVVDAHGELVAFLRTDDCVLPAISVAINKAFTAARDRKESGAIGKSSREDGFPLTNYGDLRYVGWAGGVPILYQGQVIGGIGVSGLSEEIEMRLARAGAASLES